MSGLHVLVLFIATLLIGCNSSAQNAPESFSRERAVRKPVQRSRAVLKTPEKYEMRTAGTRSYDPKPRVLVVDEGRGMYELRWIGQDGREKVVQYQRADAIKAIVEATVDSASDGKRRFRYRITNFEESPSYLSGFLVQTFATDIRKERIPVADDIYVGHMSQQIPQFKDGLWRRFAPLGENRPKVTPGRSIEFSIASKALPGVVECKVSAGDLTLKGVGEHMPYELERAMPGYDELASCLTIGPVERLASLPAKDRKAYLVENLPKFVDAGWMTVETSVLYERILNEKGFGTLFEQARSDLQTGLIMPEVFHIIEGLAD